jgi:hypothetical protein
MAGKNMASNPKQRDKKDQDRVASMADEGGVAGAETDLREQLDVGPRGAKKRRRTPWMLGAAAAGATVGGVALARTVGARRSKSASDAEAAKQTERGSFKAQRSAKATSQRTASDDSRVGPRSGARALSARKGSKSARKAQPIQLRAERGTGSPKRTRGGNNLNVRKGSRKGPRSRQTTAQR